VVHPVGHDDLGSRATPDERRGQWRRHRIKRTWTRQSRYLNNGIEQDHRAIKRRVRPMLISQSAATARVILGGIKIVHMMREQQAKYACNQQLSLSEQFDMLAA
jgi:putative transposase